MQQTSAGERELVTSPEPLARPGQLLIRNACSLIASGTERMIRQLGSQSVLSRKSGQDGVRRLLEQVRDDGLLETVRQARARFDEPIPMGYSSAGTVIACGAGVEDFKPGDRVASNGPHAEVVCVPRHLCARIPSQVNFEQAAFTTLGAIAMQGVRLSRLALSETALVVGLGLIGQLTVGVLRAAGCRVVGVDPDARRCRLAERMGAITARPALVADVVEQATAGLGADAVLIASSTYSSAPLDLAARAVRQKGRIVLVGVVGMELERQPFYYKEAEFVVSCSYGPGRYDQRYEEQGHDYPPAYVRWTEQRNMQAVLDLMAGGLDVQPLITHRFPIAEAGDAYELVDGRQESHLGVLLEYPELAVSITRHRLQLAAPRPGNRRANLAVLGAGPYAATVLLPHFVACGGLEPAILCSDDGVSASQVGQRLGFATAVSDPEEVFRDAEVRALAVLTPPEEHGPQVVRAIREGLQIFVQKPLCTTLEDLAAIEDALARSGPDPPLLMVGFSRRFAAATREVREFFADVREPLAISIRVHAGEMPADVDPDTFGPAGRIVNEACQAIDLATCLAGSPPVRVFAESLASNGTGSHGDHCFMTLRHENGALSSIAFLTGRENLRVHERVEVTGAGRHALIEGFRTVELTAGGKRRRRRRRGRGLREAVNTWARLVAEGGPSPVSWNDTRAVTRASILALRSLREGVPFEV